MGSTSGTSQNYFDLYQKLTLKPLKFKERNMKITFLMSYPVGERQEADDGSDLRHVFHDSDDERHGRF